MSAAMFTDRVLSQYALEMRARDGSGKNPASTARWLWMIVNGGGERWPPPSFQYSPAGYLSDATRDAIKAAIARHWEAQSDSDTRRGESEWRSRHEPRDQSPPVSDADARRLLEVGPGASQVEIKRAYRLKLSRLHPDKLESKDLPPELMRYANQLTRDVRQAYELLQS